jgi:hypothetical protein
MPFMNEIVSEEDINKYALDELMREFRPFAWHEGRPSTFVHAWTIDRDRDIYFIPVKTVEEVGPSGRPEPTRRKVCILNWQGKRVRALINLAAESSVRFSEPLFRIVWELLELDTSQLPNVPRSEIIQVLKEALTVFGHHGAHRQIPSTVVEFKF